MKRFSNSMRAMIFAVIVIVAISASLFSFFRSRGHDQHSGIAVATGARIRRLGDGNELLFRSTALDRNFGTVAAVAADTEASRVLTPLRCDRLDFEGGRGLCLTQSTKVFGFTTVAVVFDTNFRSLHTVQLAGLASRVRVSSDGRYGATTTFVHGDSYADLGFSTRTSIISMQTGAIVLSLEKLHVSKDGRPFHNLDFNFWGVTFAPNGTHFYATLGTGGRTYLVEGAVGSTAAHVLRAGVECPSVSPDGTRIAFKKRNPGPIITWRIAVLDLSNMTEHVVAETRNVDDQVAWLNDRVLMYGLPQAAGRIGELSVATPGAPILGGQASIQTNTWTVPADGSGTPKMIIRGAWSAIPVHGS